tara:strand:+ start:664 stop:1035 length:372 start_codon:yes stop_codon:yes gene_type:complete
MKTEKLLKQNPNVAKALHKWMFDKLTESFKDFNKDEAFKDYMLAKGVSDNQVQSIVENNPRACFDLLDSYNIVVTVKCEVEGWTNNYYPSEDDKTYDSRLACEKAGLELGILKLEKLLEDETS